MAKKPETPIREKEIPHLGRAASDLGFDSVDEYLGNLYQRLHLFAVECHEWNEKQKETQNEAEDTP